MKSMSKAFLLGTALMLGLAGCVLRSAAAGGTPDFGRLVPAAWHIEKVLEIDADGDEEAEWVIIYRYDSPTGAEGPLGGVVYDPQPDRLPQNPASLVAYHLLPAPGKRGYLGEQSCRVEAYDANGDGRKELVILGYGVSGLPTGLAIFGWVDRQTGYRSMIQEDMLWGDAGIELEPGFGRGPIKRVIVRRRLYQPYWYLRSQLGQRIAYGWNADGTRLEKRSEGIDFAFGRPEGASKPGQSAYPVTYPEAAVLAYYGPGQVQQVTALQEDGNQARVTVKVIVDGRLVEQVCHLVRRSTGKVSEGARWEVNCSE